MSEFRWGGDEMVDDTCLVLNGLGKKCTGCGNVTQNQFLMDGKCPDCRDVSPPGGFTSFGTNGGVKCDRSSGPCSCGAWH